MDVNNDALGFIFERVDSHVSLIHAAAVCKKWRRVIADTFFLSHFHSLHAPPVAGYYHNSCDLFDFQMHAKTINAPVFIPSSPSMVDARHFSLDFLPGGAASWSVTDSCGSLLVVMDIKGRPFPGHIVCEPLTRRYVMIPQPMDSNNISYWWGPYLLDGEANEVGGRISMSNFRVLCIFDCNRITHTAIFTAGSSWIHTNFDRIAPILEGRRAWALGRAAGCCYFYDERRSMTLVHLDGSTGEFSSSVLPANEDWSSHVWRYNCYITEGCDSKPRIIVVFDDTMKVFSRLDSTEWALEKEIQLTETTCSLPWYRHDQEISHSHNIVTVGVGFVILSQFQDFGKVQLFSVNLETMEASQAPPAAKNMGWRVYQCKLPWPPALHSCLY